MFSSNENMGKDSNENSEQPLKQTGIKALAGAAIAAILAGTLIALSIFTYLKNKSPESPDAQPVPNQTTTPSETDAPAKPRVEIAFSTSLTVLHRSTVADTNAPLILQCPEGEGQTEEVGYLVLDEETKAALICKTGSVGGVAIVYTNGQGEIVTKNLAMQDSDSGDRWDTRSWFLKLAPEKGEPESLTLQTVTLTSSETDGEVMGCKESSEFYTWNPQTKDFVETAGSTEFDLSTFTVPIGIDPRCLSDDGLWKGGSPSN
jgi:hypothetical protein